MIIKSTEHKYDIRFCFSTLSTSRSFEIFNEYEEIKFNGLNYCLLSTSVFYYEFKKVFKIYNNQLVIEL